MTTMSKIIFSILLVLACVFPWQIKTTYAVCPPDCSSVEEQKNTNSSSSKTLTNPLGVTDPSTLIGRVIKAVLGIVGSLALLMFVYGGFMWMLSAGNEKMIEKGKSTLMWAALGLVVIFMSYALVNFVISTATSGG